MCYKKVVRQKRGHNEEIGEERKGNSQIPRESKTEYLTKETTLKVCYSESERKEEAKKRLEKRLENPESKLRRSQ